MCGLGFGGAGGDLNVARHLVCMAASGVRLGEG